LQVVRGDGDVEGLGLTPEPAQIEIAVGRGPVDERVGPQGQLGGQRRLDGDEGFLRLVAEARDEAPAERGQLDALPR
jgi:hypothetical protein